MAVIVQRDSANVVILAPRENLSAPFSFDGDWTEIRCGIFCSMLAYRSDTENSSYELVIAQDIDDWMTIGIKNSSDQSIPGQEGSSFAGVSTFGALGSDGTELLPFGYNKPPVQGEGNITNRFGTARAIAYDEEDADDQGVIANGRMLFKDAEDPSLWSGFYCLKFVVSGRGSPSQTISVSASSKQEVLTAAYTPASLQQEMNGAIFGAAKTFNWAPGGTPRDIPDAFWIRLPFFRNRLRIAAMRIIKYG